MVSMSADHSQYRNPFTIQTLKFAELLAYCRWLWRRRQPSFTHTESCHARVLSLLLHICIRNECDALLHNELQLYWVFAYFLNSLHLTNWELPFTFDSHSNAQTGNGCYNMQTEAIERKANWELWTTFFNLRIITVDIQTTTKLNCCSKMQAERRMKVLKGKIFIHCFKLIFLPQMSHEADFSVSSTEATTLLNTSHCVVKVL